MSSWDGQDRRWGADSRLERLEKLVGDLSQSLDSFRQESIVYRREAKRDLKCISDTWAEYLPLFKMLRAREERRERQTEKIKAHVIGWGLVAAIGGLVAMLGEHVQRIFKG